MTVDSRRARRAALLGLGVIHVLVSTFAVVPGYLSIDEAIYHLSTRDFVATGGFGILTGYAEFPSPELVHSFLSVQGGRPVSSYPYLFPFLAAPFYAVLGYRGLFALNAICFVGVLVLTHALARKLLGDPVLALDACLILALATFAWEYSQAAWPHMVSLVFATGAMLLVAVALRAGSRRTAALAALGAGAVAGFGPGVRLDGALVLPCVVLPFVFARPWRPRDAALALAGAVPGLALLGWTNFLKFGSPNPFSYGNLFGEVMVGVGLRAGAVAALLLALAWLLTRESLAPFVARHRWAFAVAGLVTAAAVVAAVPVARTVLHSGWAQLVDARAYDPSLLEPWVPRSAGGGVVYLDAEKEALLQDLPYLVVVLFPLLWLLRRRSPGEGAVPGTDHFAVSVMWFVPLATASYYACWGYDGGLCLDLRLLLPALPFLSILVAYAAHSLAIRWETRLGARGWAISAGLAAVAFFALTRARGMTVDEQEFPLLVVPLVLAATLLALLAGGELLRAGRARTLVRRAAWGVLATSLTWAGLVGFLYDYPHCRARRQENYAIGGAALDTVPPDSILFTSDFPDPFMRLVEQHGVRLAFPFQDGFREFRALLDFELRKGRRAFAAFRPAQWQLVRPMLLRGYSVVPVWDLGGQFLLCEILGPARAAP